MKKSNILICTLIIIFLGSSFTEINAQIRRKKSTDRTEKRLYTQDDDDYESRLSLRDRIYLGSYVTVPGIFSSNTGTSIGIGLQPFAAYKFNEYIHAGVTFKFDYFYFLQNGASLNLTDFATTTFVRAVIANQIIVQLEGGLYSDQRAFTFNQKERVLFPISLVSLGYSWGNSEVLIGYELTGNFITNGIFPFEYKFGFIFNL